MQHLHGHSSAKPAEKLTPKQQEEKDQRDYEDFVAERIGDLAKEHAMGTELTAETCVIALEPDNSANSKIRGFVTKKLGIKAPDFDRALRTTKVINRFGRYPKSASDLVDLLAKELRLKVRYNGRINQDAVPFLDGLIHEDYARKPAFIPPDQADDPVFKMYVQNRFKDDMEYHQFRRKVRVVAKETGLPWRPSDLNDACDQWYDEQRRDRLWRLFEEIEYSGSLLTRQKGEDALRLLATTCFDDPEGPEFVVAILKKFFWQVKRKMSRLPIHNHLFAVLINPKQGGGKSTLLRRLIDPASETAIPADFKAIADEKIISIWRNFIMYPDEMGWASKSNVETIKNVISADTVMRRPMTTNQGEEIRQNATFIGSANVSDISEIIRDVTGTRRFIGLRTRDKLDWDVVNNTDYTAIWQCVDQEADDPTLPYWEKLQARQEQERPKTNVETWIAQFNPKVEFGVFDKNRRLFEASELHERFRRFEDQCFPGDKTNINWFGRHLAQAHASPFEKTAKHGVWRYVGDLPGKGTSDVKVIPMVDEAAR
jgi:hypothetical protein